MGSLHWEVPTRMSTLAEPRLVWPVSTLTERLAAEIAGRILDGKLAAGERIIEASFASEFRVSHSPIRDAFRI
jgi:DNA-binding GntR family transcriptional regulator